jgi:phage/plasmid-associated DNA primase
LPELVHAANRHTFILFDANAATNEKVQAARKTFRKTLRKLKAKVTILDLPQGDWNGPDDYLAKNTDEALKQVFLEPEPPKAKIPPSPLEPPGRLPITEVSNAERLAKRWGEELNYAADRRVWNVWNGRYWAVNDVVGAESRMQETAKSIYMEAAGEDSQELRASLAAWARKSEAQRVIHNSLDAARCHLAIPKFSLVFDTHKMLLNLSNRTVDLADGLADHPHRREDFLTKIINIEYDPTAKCPHFQNFLFETFQGSLPLIGYITRLVGYFLTGCTGEVLATNHAPIVPAGDEALWRRLKVVPFRSCVPEDKRIDGFAEKLLHEEGPGILNWALAGCVAWQLQGLQEPPEVTSAIGEYRDSQDVASQFLSAFYDRVDDERTLMKDVQIDFAEYAKQELGWKQPWSKKKLCAELKRLGVEMDLGRRFYLGIQRKDSVL